MDQKNTIVKCKAHPNCLFNYNGVCDNYVINIGADGKCEGYIETASEEEIENGVIGEYKAINITCGDCEYFGNIDNCPVYKRTHVLFGMDPICLDFKARRGQRAKCNFINDGVDQETVNEVCKPFDIKPSAAVTLIGTTTDNWVEMCNQINYTSDWDYAATPDICKTCKKVVYGQPCKWKDVAYGVWTCYERDKSIQRAGTLNECWWCDFFNSEKRSCKQKHPDIDKYGCHSSQSTGGNR